MSDIVERAREVVGAGHVLTGSEIHADYTHDEALTATPVEPVAVAMPATTAEVAGLLEAADELRVPVVARGRGTGLSGGCLPVPDGLVVAFDRMDRVLEIDEANHAAVVQPGVTLRQLDEALSPLRLVYPVSPGEMGASLGGNVATNAGGMRAVRYGVTRHQVIGLEVALPGGRVIRTGGKFVKSSTGYDLTQLLIGSEGTLGLVTEVTLRLHPRPLHAATVLAPFAALAEVGAAIPPIVNSGLQPVILEYLDMITMSGITDSAGLALGIEADVKERALAYLVVVLESPDGSRIEEDVERLGELLGALGAIDVYVLPAQAGAQLIEARERAFFVAKAAGADDIVDTVVPRAAIPSFLQTVSDLAAAEASLVTGCGHAGDGNVHLSVFQPDAARRKALVREILTAAGELGGAVSGEHGIGTEKRSAFLDLEDPVKLELMRGIKAVFDPHGILAPGHVLETGQAPEPGHLVEAGAAR